MIGIINQCSYSVDGNISGPDSNPVQTTPLISFYSAKFKLKIDHRPAIYYIIARSFKNVNIYILLCLNYSLNIQTFVTL